VTAQTSDKRSLAMPRASDFLGTRIAETDVEFRKWAVCVLDIWIRDSFVRADFDDDVILFFDAAFVIVKELIESAEEK
jgi:hypothetical protein